MKRWFKKLFKAWGEEQPSRVYVMPQANSPSHSGVPNADSSNQRAGSGHRERHSFVLREPIPGELIDDTNESWERHGDIMEGHTVESRVISASQEIVKAEDLQSICSVCGKPDNFLVRSEISNRTLCRTCQRVFTRPDESTIIVSPDEYLALWDSYDTWSAFDYQRSNRGGQR